MRIFLITRLGPIIVGSSGQKHQCLRTRMLCGVLAQVDDSLRMI